jgi:hypothetical protein
MGGVIRWLMSTIPSTLRRRYINRTTDLAAALCQIKGCSCDRLVPHDVAKTKTARQIIALFHRDHYPIAHADGGPDTHWNLTWRIKADHASKTRRDMKQFAKDRRLRTDEIAHKQRMLLKGKRRKPKISRWPSRPFTKRKDFRMMRQS